MPVIIEFSRCISTYSSAKFELSNLVFAIPLLKEEMENQSYREECRRRGDKTYWSTDGLRYTSTNKKSRLWIRSADYHPHYYCIPTMTVQCVQVNF